MNQKSKRWVHMYLFSLIFVTAACQSQESQELPELEEGAKQAKQASKQDMNAALGEISVDEQIEVAMADLANRLGITVDAILVKEARSVQWGSGAMGCPKPGMNYTQALVPGVRLLLEANGTIYYYHGSRRASLFSCPADRARAPAYGQGTEVM